MDGNKPAWRRVTTGLAGAMAMAGGTTAYAGVVVVSTPADLTNTPGSPNVPANWDVNGDGVVDFIFNNRYPNTTEGGPMGGVVWQLAMNPVAGTNGLISYSGPFLRYANALTTGFSIGTGGAFSTASQVILGSRYNFAGVGAVNYGGFAAGGPNGSVSPGTQAYVGFQFSDSGGQIHYGWVLLSVNAGIIDFVSAAYESTANTAILAGAVPEPGTLAGLAFGAAAVAGVVIRKRRQRS